VLDPVVANTGPVRRQVGELVPCVLGGLVFGPVGPQRAGEVGDDAPVLAGVPRQRHGFADALDPPLRVRERPVLLGERRGGEYDGFAPASFRPWTLFWPRSAFRPVDSYPRWPVMRTRFASDQMLSIALACSVIPSV